MFSRRPPRRMEKAISWPSAAPIPTDDEGAGVVTSFYRSDIVVTFAPPSVAPPRAGIALSLLAVTLGIAMLAFIAIYPLL
ncbi:hypothetical protein IZ6_12800 [Terrihabitans soli]|uniref:Uncharacterized protein n=1 Tax=Terrihabitans soli TaxID=708113 RepID=A0A6S6QS62_9HYPH|nr:hypothetical protein [Terrihabitans soli]BCJ90545.1 hypothetical protein IZ6_12800 [Terrihabitans soli]